MFSIAGNSFFSLLDALLSPNSQKSKRMGKMAAVLVYNDCFGLGVVIVLQGSARVVNPAGKRSEALRCYPLC